MENWGVKPDKRSINKKPPELDEEKWEENRKIIDIIDKKTFPSGLRTRKEKPEDCVEIADRKIDDKSSKPVEIEEENRF